MIPAPSRRASPWTCVAGAVAYGLFILALLPAQVIVLDDDFGYLKSILQTLQHGRPWTNDFLEPWNAASSSISAAVFALTRNFYLATYGLQAVFAGLFFFVLCVLLRSRRFSLRLTLSMAALIVGFPVLLCRVWEYTGVTLYLPCLVTAIFAAERRRWGMFAVVWLLAVANRQSAAVWLVLPAFAAVRSALANSGGARSAALLPGAVVLGGVASLGVLHAAMNATDAQRMLLFQTFERFQPATALRSIGAGAVVFAVAAGLAGALLTLSGRPPAPRPAWRGPALGFLVAAAAVLLLIDERYLANPDHIDIRWRAGWAYSKLVVALGLAGWIGFRFRVRPAPALCAAAGVIMLGLRANSADYYYIDAGLLGFFAVRPLGRQSAAPACSSLLLARFWRPAMVGALALAGLFHLQCAVHLKTVSDEAAAVVTLYERALREGKIEAHELIDAPFGFAGWHLYARAIELRTNLPVRWFSRLLAAPVKSVGLATVYADSFPRRWREPDRAMPDRQLAPLAETTVRVGWFWDCRYVLQRQAPPLSPSPLGPDFRPIRFPLNNAEWRELAAGPPLR